MSATYALTRGRARRTSKAYCALRPERGGPGHPYRLAARAVAKHRTLYARAARITAMTATLRESPLT
jgi:hypothetical protein